MTQNPVRFLSLHFCIDFLNYILVKDGGWWKVGSEASTNLRYFFHPRCHCHYKLRNYIVFIAIAILLSISKITLLPAYPKISVKPPEEPGITEEDWESESEEEEAEEDEEVDAEKDKVEDEVEEGGVEDEVVEDDVEEVNEVEVVPVEEEEKPAPPPPPVTPPLHGEKVTFIWEIFVFKTHFHPKTKTELLLS